MMLRGEFVEGNCPHRYTCSSKSEGQRPVINKPREQQPDVLILAKV